jgi:hypothetical protein
MPFVVIIIVDKVIHTDLVATEAPNRNDSFYCLSWEPYSFSNFLGSGAINPCKEFLAECWFAWFYWKNPQKICLFKH